MFEAFGHLLKLFTDKTVKWTAKSATVLVIFLLLWWVNNMFDFGHSYRLSNKLEHLEKISLLLKDTSLTNEQQLVLKAERSYIFEHKSAFDHIYNYCSSFPSEVVNFIHKNLYNKKVEPSKYVKSQKNTIPMIKTRDRYWHFITSSIIIWLFCLFVIYLMVTDKKTLIGNLILGIIGLLLVAYITSLLFATILSLIPVFDHLWINYGLNVLIQLIILGYFLYIDLKKRKR